MKCNVYREISKTLAGMALLGMAAAAPIAPARADVANYSSERRQIKACVLVSEACINGYNNSVLRWNNPAPHLFYALESRTDYKPGGWTFVNPLAPSTVTQTMINRWSNRPRTGATDPAFVNGTPESQLFQLGARLTKNLAPYWEVNLDQVSDDDLGRFDVVFIALQGGRDYTGAGAADLVFSEDEREKLRHFMDRGGTIWVENQGANTLNPSNGGGFPVTLKIGPNPPANTEALIAEPFHPLINYPYPITQTETLNLGAYASNLPAHGVFVDINGNNNPVAPNFMQPILTQGAFGLVYAGDYGAGHLLLTQPGIAADINDFLGGANGVGNLHDLNDGVVSGDNFAAAPQTDLKFAYNAIAWISSVPTTGGGVRRSGATAETIGNNIAVKWSTFPDPKNLAPGNNPGAGAVISRNVAFSIDGFNVLHAYNLDPGQSLSNTVAGDEGKTDFLQGKPYDEIWNIQLTSNAGSGVRYSTPSVISLNNNGQNVDVVVTTNTAGITELYYAFLRDNEGHLTGNTQRIFQFHVDADTNKSPSLSQYTTQNLKLPVASPAFSEGILFTPVYRQFPDDATGWHISALDLRASVQNRAATNVFGAGTPGMMPTDNFTFTGIQGLADIVGPLTIGYVRDSGGATDEVVYAATQATQIKNTPFNYARDQQGAVWGLWFRTRNEPLRNPDGAGIRWQPTNTERSWAPWFVPAGGPPSGLIDLSPVAHVTHKNTNLGTGQVTTTVTDYAYGGGGFTVAFGNNNPDPLATNPGGNPGQHYMEIDFATPIPANTTTDTYSVSVDYVLDWPGAPVNGQAVNSADMAVITNHRQFQLFPGNTALGQFHYMAGGAALGNDDTLYFATNPNAGFQGGTLPNTTSGVFDEIVNQMMPGRIYGYKDQFSVNNATAPSKPVMEWMFWPTYQETFNGQAIKPRIVNTDDFGVGYATNQVLDTTPNANLLPPNPFQIVGQPVVKDGVVYAIANVRLVGSQNLRATIVLALNQHVNSIIQLPTPIVYLTPGATRPNRISVQQPDVTKATLGSLTYNTLLQNQDFAPVTQIDPQSGAETVTAIQILTARNGSQQGADAFNTALPIWVTDGAGNPQVITNGAGFGPQDNLLWYLVIPTNGPVQARYIPQQPPISLPPDLFNLTLASSGPSIFGSTLYYTTTTGQLVSVDLKGAANGHLIDPKTKLAYVHAQGILTDTTTGQTFATGTAPVTPPIATNNTIVIGAADGVAAFDNQLTLIADSNRLLEVDAGSAAVWSLDGTRQQLTAGGAVSGPGVGNAAPRGTFTYSTVPLAQPNLAHRSTPDNYLVADTGNNRVIQLDRGGKVVAEVHTFNDGMHILRPGDPLVLNHPTDVEIYPEQWRNATLSIQSQITGATYTYRGGYYAVHYLIADSGNFRSIEVMDAYNLQTGQPLTVVNTNDNNDKVVMFHQVIFTTKSLSEQNQQLRYRTIQLFDDPSVGNLFEIVGAIDNVRLPEQTFNDVSGQVLSSDGTAQVGSGGTLIFIVRDPGTSGANVGDITLTTSHIGIPAIPVGNGGKIVRELSISSPTWFKEFKYQDPENPNAQPLLRFLLADSNGCYELSLHHVDRNDGVVTINDANPIKNELVVEWMLTDADYYYLTGRHLKALSIQRLNSVDALTDTTTGTLYLKPRYLITNGYHGADSIPQLFPRDANNNALANLTVGQVSGEVFEIRGLDYYLLPPQNGTRRAAIAADGTYNGYHPVGNWLAGDSDVTTPYPYRFYQFDPNPLNLPALNGLLELNPKTVNSLGSSITRMIPGETLPGIPTNGLPQPIQRSIGSTANGTSAALLEEPRFSERPL